MKIKDVRNKLENLKGKQSQIKHNLNIAKDRLRYNKRYVSNLQKAREIVRKVAVQTQSQLSYNISEISTLAIESVITKDPYKLVIDFVERRNKTECDIMFEREGNKIDPYSAGGGAIDIAAFALRVSSWTMKRPQFDNVLILDEPFKHLKGSEANTRMLQMVKEISEKLGLQIIMVSDERVDREITLEVADRLFEVSIKNGMSKVELKK